MSQFGDLSTGDFLTDHIVIRNGQGSLSNVPEVVPGPP